MPAAALERLSFGLHEAVKPSGASRAVHRPAWSCCHVICSFRPDLCCAGTFKEKSFCTRRGDHRTLCHELTINNRPGSFLAFFRGPTKPMQTKVSSFKQQDPWHALALQAANLGRNAKDTVADSQIHLRPKV